MQREENATSIRHFVESRLLLCARRFLSSNEKNVFQTWMEETTCRPKGLFQKAHISVFPLLEDPLSVLFFFFFFRRKKGAYLLDSLEEREKGRERESLSFSFFLFFNNTSMPPLWRQRQKEAADRSVTSRNKSGIAQQRNDFGQDRPGQLRCSFAARLSASRIGEVHSNEELIQDTTASKRQTVQDEGHNKYIYTHQ